MVSAGLSARALFVALACACSVSCMSATPEHSATKEALKAMINASKLWNEKPMLESRDFMRSLYMGDSERARHAVMKMVSGEKVTIALVGGSITHGVGAVEGMNDITTWLRRWAAIAFPDGRVTILKASFPGVGSAYLNLCLKNYVTVKNVDFVFVELAINDAVVAEDTIRRPFEQLIRKLLRLRDSPPASTSRSSDVGAAGGGVGSDTSIGSRPAVVLLNVFSWHHMGHPRGRYHMNAEAQFFDFATYYGLSVLSLKAATYHHMVAGKHGFRVDALRYNVPPNETYPVDSLFYDDLIHPNGATGHRVIAEMVVRFLVHTAQGLRHHPWQPETELPFVHAPLPRPLIYGNYENIIDQCLLGPKLQTTVLALDRFEWLNEGTARRAPKWGYTALVPGASIAFTVNTLRSSVPAAQSDGQGEKTVVINSTVTLSLAFLTSYKSMGKATVTCVSGCECDLLHFNALDTIRNVSQLTMACQKVTQSAECVVKVVVSDESDSDGHKIKIGGLIVSEDYSDSFSCGNFEAIDWAAGFAG